MTAKSTRRSDASRPFTMLHFKRWARELVLDSDESFVLQPFQERFIADVFAGFQVCWLVIPEGNGKTTLASALALYHVQHTTSGYVPVAASSREQAEWLYRQAEGFVYRSGLRGSFKCLEGYRRIRCDEMGSRIQVFAADDRSGDGIIPTLAILDELHRHKDLGLYRTWMGKLRKRGGQLVVISTAGEVGGEFEQERRALRQDATRADAKRASTRARRMLGRKRLAVLHEYAVPEEGDVEDLRLVKAANPHRDVTVDYLEEKRQLPGMTLDHWSRFTCNVASRSSQAAITQREWAAAGTDERIPARQAKWAGLDVAWKWDTTALVPLWWRDEDFRLLGDPTILTPPRDQSQLHPDEVKRALIAEHERGPIVTLVMDTSSAEDIAAWAADEIGCTVVDRGQSNAFAAQDYARFMEALRGGQLWHTGHPGLRRHVLNAVARTLPYGDARFDRPSASRRGSEVLQEQRVIDALTAAAMVHSTAVAELLAEPEPETAWRAF